MDDDHTDPTRSRRVWTTVVSGLVVLGGLAILFQATSPSAPTTTSEAVAIAPPAVAGNRSAEPVPGWISKAPGSLSPRSGQAAIWTGGELIVFGGRSFRGGTDDGAAYSPSRAATDQWEAIPPAPINASPTTALAWTGERLYLFTGAAAIFDSAQERWRSLALPPVTPSHPVAAEWTGSEIILIGYERHPPRIEDNLFAVAYGPEGECCRRLPDPPIDLSYGQAFWTGAELLLIGGFDGEPGGAEPTAALAAYSPATDAWTTLEPPPLTGIQELSATWTGDSLVAVDFHLAAASWTPLGGWEQLGDVPIPLAGCIPRTTTIAGDVFVWYCREAAISDDEGGGWIPIATPDLDPHAVSTSCMPVAAQEVVLMWCGNGDGAEPFFWEVDPANTEVRR